MFKETLIAGLIVSISTVANATSGGGDKTLSPKDKNAENTKYFEQLLGVEIPVPEFKVDYEAENSELGKLSKSILGQLYTHVLSIEYKSDKEAVVKARIGKMFCNMEFITMNFSGDKEPSWKLNKLNCL